MTRSHIILAVGWIVFCALHSVFASIRFKQWIKKLMGSHYTYFRLYYSIFAFITMIIMMAWLFTLPSPNLFTKTPATNITGAVITLAGFTVMSLCIYKYFFQLSGLKSLVENRVNNELMITGIHKHVRHPLYSGTFVFIWGLLILIPTWSVLIADAIITIYTLIGLRFEEQKLVREFGEKYLEYKRQVPMILPRIL